MFVPLLNAGVKLIDPYIPAKPASELGQIIGRDDIVSLATNENPLGVSKKVIGAVQNALSEIANYADSECWQLKRKLAQKLNIAPESLVIGNGSNEILTLIARAFLNDSTAVIFSQYSFIVYKIVSQLMNAQLIEVSAKNWHVDLSGMLLAITNKTRVIFIASPNNPTGTFVPIEELSWFLKKVPNHIIVVIDEAYYEYVTNAAYATAINFINRHPNLIVVRTFSKAYGLAGLRVGYSISHPEMAKILNTIKDVINVNRLAQVAACAALGDEKYLQETVSNNNRGKKQLEIGLEKLNIDYIPSVANFITMDLKQSAADVFKQLFNQGVIVCPLTSYNLPNHLRVTIGLEWQNQRLLAALAVKGQQ